MISKLKANELWGNARFGPRGARLHQDHPLLVVHDVQRLAHERVCAGSAKDFKAAEVDALAFYHPRSEFRHFAYALTAGIIDVPGPLALVLFAVNVLRIHRLPPGHAQLVPEIPSHLLQMR